MTTELQQPGVADVLELSYAELRGLDFEELLELLDELGIDFDGVETRTEALTLLVEHSV